MYNLFRRCQLHGNTGLTIEPGAKGPLYRQIVQQLTALITQGVYPPGYRLPTTRELAQELDVHRNTVVRAFEEMASSGLVHTIVGSGTYVAKSEDVVEPTAAPQRGSMPWNALVSDAANSEPLTRYDRLARNIYGSDLINLSRMHPSNDLIPHELIRKCNDFVLRRFGPDSLGYAPPDGLPRLREHIARELWRAKVPANAEEIVITTGSQQGLDLIARLLFNPGDTVLMEEHSYPGAITAFAATGARMTAVDCDDEGPIMSTLEQLISTGAKALYLMPNCSNPTGSCISVSRRRQLVEWSHRSGIPLIEDDYGADLGDSAAPVSLRALDSNVLYLGTFSKKLVPALRIGYLLCPEGLISRLVALKQAMDLGTSLLHQHVLAEFIDRGYLRTHLRRIQPVYAGRRTALAEALREHLPESIKIQVPNLGVVFWINLPEPLDPDEVFHEAMKQGVLVSPSSFHSVNRHASAGIRMTFCAEPRERLVEGARRLGKALKVLSGRRTTKVFSMGSTSLDGV